METCKFSYIRLMNHQITTALGIERSWSDIKNEFGLSVEPLPDAKYYKTISLEGPELFAVDSRSCVFYHDNGKWFPYKTASNIQFSSTNDFNPKRAQNELENQRVFDDASQQSEDKYGINDAEDDY